MTITYNDQSYALLPQETVLNCFLRHGVEYPHSCRAGICQSCLIKTKPEHIHPDWQAGLPETLKIQGYFLACLAKPIAALHVSTPNQTECEYDAHIIEINALNHNVMQLKLVTDHLSAWIPGQYLNLINPEGIIRSYSIANIPAEDHFIELHIKMVPEGSMGKWLMHHIDKNSAIKLRGPFGRCFYHNPDKKVFDIVLAGTGTGLAPLIAILKSALAHHHTSNITLIHGGVCEADIYYQDVINHLIKKHPAITYDRCVLQSQGKIPEIAIEKQLLSRLTNPGTTHVYICGPKETTNKLKKTAFLAGVASNAIFSDPFL